MQNISNGYAYFIGKSHKIGNNVYQPLTYGCFPTVNFAGVDSHVPELTDQAISWVRRVKNNWYGWSTCPPTNNFLYPNMKSRYNTQYHRQKLEIAKDIGEITLIMYCGVKQRDMAFTKGIFSWMDPLLSAEIMGFRDKKARLINSIININRQQDKLLTYRKKPILSHNIDTTIFLDIETFEGYVYMIGFVYRNRYFNFTADLLDNDQEKNILRQLYNFISDNQITTIIHHSQFDKRIITSKFNTYSITQSDTRPELAPSPSGRTREAGEYGGSSFARGAVERLGGKGAEPPEPKAPIAPSPSPFGRLAPSPFGRTRFAGESGGSSEARSEKREGVRGREAIKYDFIQVLPITCIKWILIK
jgi:hypothetical protein